jgi:hypothetical protein
MYKLSVMNSAIQSTRIVNPKSWQYVYIPFFHEMRGSWSVFWNNARDFFEILKNVYSEEGCVLIGEYFHRVSETLRREQNSRLAAMSLSMFEVTWLHRVWNALTPILLLPSLAEFMFPSPKININYRVLKAWDPGRLCFLFTFNLCLLWIFS